LFLPLPLLSSTSPETVISTEAAHAFVSSGAEKSAFQLQPSLNFNLSPPGCPMFATASSSLTWAPFCRRPERSPKGASDCLLGNNLLRYSASRKLPLQLGVKFPFELKGLCLLRQIATMILIGLVLFAEELC